MAFVAIKILSLHGLLEFALRIHVVSLYFPTIYEECLDISYKTILGEYVVNR